MGHVIFGETSLHPRALRLFIHRIAPRSGQQHPDDLVEITSFSNARGIFRSVHVAVGPVQKGLWCARGLAGGGEADVVEDKPTVSPLKRVAATTLAMG